MTDPHTIARSLSRAQRKEPAMTSEREPVDDAALIAEAERLAIKLWDCGKGPVLTYPQLVGREALRLAREGWQPSAPEPDRAAELAQALWDQWTLRAEIDVDARTLINDAFDELRAEWEAERPVIDVPSEVVGSLERLVAVIKMAGVHNLSNGVQLGQISWAMKCNDAIAWAEKALSFIDGAGVRAKGPSQ